MFKSISNNFGGPEIMFRAAQHDRYAVLNAHFTYDPADTAYLAANELEIKVPDLSMDKSTEAGVIAVCRDKRRACPLPFPCSPAQPDKGLQHPLHRKGGRL